MKTDPPVAPPLQPELADSLEGSDLDQISQNIAAVQQFYLREERKLTSSQRLMERVGSFIGRPACAGFILIAVAGWMAADLALRHLGLTEFDPPPFYWLQGIVDLSALLTAIVVLSKQNRLAKLAEQRAHLDLKVTLLTEQKAAKLIDLLEELRRDLPNVKDRHDSDATVLKQSMSPDLVLAALREHKGSDGGLTSVPQDAEEGDER